MERLVPSILLILLAPTVAAIEDPAGDVGATVGGEPVDVPYIDIRNVSAAAEGLNLHLRMELDGILSAAPAGLELNYIFLIDLDGTDGSLVYGQQDLTVLCTKNTTSGAFGCADPNQDPDAAYAVTSAGLDDRNVTATVRLKAQDADVGVAGAASRVEGGAVTAQDFTDNALPYSSRPSTSQEPDIDVSQGGGAAQGWLMYGGLAALLLIGFVGYKIWRQRA